jgi:predicted Zn-ribbon and HTH transcriptional regulator
MVVYLIIAVLVVALAVVTLAALAIGVLSMLGVVRLARCARCGHLTLTDARLAPGSCPQCRHEHLTHPFAALHRIHPPAVHR